MIELQSFDSAKITEFKGAIICVQSSCAQTGSFFHFPRRWSKKNTKPGL